MRDLFNLRFPIAVHALVLLTLVQTALAEEGGPSQANGKVAAQKRGEHYWILKAPGYQSSLLGPAANLALDLRVGKAALTVIEKSQFLVFGKDWKRLLDQNQIKISRRAIEPQNDGSVVVRFEGKNDLFSLKSENVCHPNRITFSYTLEALQDIDECRRIGLEINPTWMGTKGAELEVVTAKDAPKTLALPTVPTKDNRYESIYSGPADSFVIRRVQGSPSAGFMIAGPLALTLEHSGERFRWHVALRREYAAPIRKGEILIHAFTLRPTVVEASSLPVVTTEVTIDAEHPGAVISPNLFGAQLGSIGFGKGSRHPQQWNPRHDALGRRLMEESGVTFFRIYLHHLYDTMGAFGGRSDQDPICPSDGAPCDYTRADDLMDVLINEMKIEVMPCVGLYCPSWLSTQRKSPYYSGLWMIHRAPPKDNQKWANIIAGMVRHFNVEKKFNVKLWQIGNEPDDWTRYWVGGTLAEFIEYFKTASKAMKGADPAIRISGPDLANLYAKAWPENKLDWKGEFVKACHPYFDDFSFNRYFRDDFSDQVKDARATLVAQGASGKTLTIAEYNQTAGDYDLPAVFEFRGALYLCRALKNLMANGIDRASFYDWGSDHLGLFDQQGSDLLPRPTYHAFRMHAKLGRFKNAKLLPVATQDSGLHANACRHDDGKGLSLILAVDNPLVREYRVSLKFDDKSGNLTARQYLLDPGNEIQEAPLEADPANHQYSIVLPNQSVALLVWRQK